MRTGDILQGDGCALAQRLAARDLSAEEVMEATLARIEAVNGAVNAIVSLRDRDVLMDQARAADTGPRKGWLHGIPVAVKDLSDAEGIPTTMGSRIYAGHLPEADAAIVRRMKAAGAIVIGKTNTPEFGLGSHTVNPVHGATRNPYDLSLTAGGSSGGAAAALAARMLVVADGSDMMGSLRNPAAYCNVYGFRPSWGRVPADPVGDLYLHRLATEGPMARSPRDILALFQVLSAPGPRWPAPGWGISPVDFTLEAPVSGRRIGWLGDWGGALAMEAGVLALVQDGLREFSAMGVTVEAVAPPMSSDEIWDSWTSLRSFSVAAKLAPLYRTQRQDLNRAAIWEVERGLALSAMDLQAASLSRSRWLGRALALFEDFDALVLPSAQVFPFDVTWDWPHEISGRQMDSYHRWMEVVVPASLLGLPSLGVPVGFDPKGRPMGMQIIGAPGADEAVLQLGEAWHQATRWPEKRPPAIIS